MDGQGINLLMEDAGNLEHGEEQNLEMTLDFPREKGWITDYFYNYQGFWYDSHFLKGVIWAQQNFKARPIDILLATFPKTGLTWLKALTFSIMNRKSSKTLIQTLLTKNPHDCIPYIEFQAYEKDPISSLESLSSPRLFSTHMPYNSLPNTIITSNSKIVCMIRDPKDVFVSMWSFLSKISLGNKPAISIEEGLELFCRGVSLCGPFWDHVLGYLEASLEHPNNVLVLKYEDLKRSTFHEVVKLAKFLDEPFSYEETENGVVQEIINLCSIENLKKLEVNQKGVFHMGNLTNAIVQNSGFFRKGEIGDWKNHLSKEIIKQLDQITEEKLKGYDIESWKNI